MHFTTFFFFLNIVYCAFDIFMFVKLFKYYHIW